MKTKALLINFLLVGTTSIGCGGSVDQSHEIASTSSPLIYSIRTFYDSAGADRTIYAVNDFKGTPRVRITTKNIFTDTCYQHEYSLFPQEKVDSKVCLSLGFLYRFISGDTSYCATIAPSPVKVDSFSYNFYSLYQSQLNYEVVDVGPDPTTGAQTIFGRSTWIGNNGCPRNFSPM